MLTIAANATIAGDASAGSVVTCTIFGMELNGTTETYKVLDQRQLAASPETIYTATANGPTFIKSITVVNTDTASQTFQLFSAGTAAANAITPVFSLLPSGCGVYEDGSGWQFYNSAGQLLSATGAPNNGVPRLDGPTGVLAQSMDRATANETNQAAPTASGTLFMQGIYIPAGVTVSNILWHSATTAANGPTHWMAGLYDVNRVLRATSTDHTSEAWAAQTMKTIAMVTPYLIPSSGLYYVGFFMTASTAVITSKGDISRTNGALWAQPPIMSGASTTGLTTALPDPAAAITAGLLPVWCAVS
jgi:hypothetical protein